MTRFLLAVPRWARLLVTVLAVLLSVPQTAHAETSLTLDATSSTARFSPNGDNQEDYAVLGFCLSTAANVTVTVAQDTGAVVARPATSRSFPSACSWNVVWDGTSSGGEQAPDGTYLVTFTAQAAEGNPATASMTVIIDRRFPGSVTAPAPTAQLSGTVALTFTPTGGAAKPSRPPSSRPEPATTGACPPRRRACPTGPCAKPMSAHTDSIDQPDTADQGDHHDQHPRTRSARRRGCHPRGARGLAR